MSRLLADDCEHWLMIHLGIVKTGDQMRGAWSRCCDADTELAGKLRVGARHERCHLLVACLDEFYFSGGALEGAEDAVDAIAGVAEQAPYAPVLQARDDEIADSLWHRISPFRTAPDRAAVANRRR